MNWIVSSNYTAAAPCTDTTTVTQSVYYAVVVFQQPRPDSHSFGQSLQSKTLSSLHHLYGLIKPTWRRCLPPLLLLLSVANLSNCPHLIFFFFLVPFCHFTPPDCTAPMLGVHKSSVYQQVLVKAPHYSPYTQPLPPHTPLPPCLYALLCVRECGLDFPESHAGQVNVAPYQEFFFPSPPSNSLLPAYSNTQQLLCNRKCLNGSASELCSYSWVVTEVWSLLTNNIQPRLGAVANPYSHVDIGGIHQKNSD